ncbi:reverse transcriptase domain-containing protein [Tanacetum coccineum]|uniref:Reverse transcriptase domain-containing protein n=1 Tax=Tanacetum coccineum TaxID=301880 RepID=A0ABQ4YX76_9ASTR
MEEVQFLGHVVSKRGIKANPINIQAMTSLKRPKTIKEVQSLNGKLAVLNRFLSKSAKKSLSFFKKLKGCLEKKGFTWTKEADKAFEEIKKYIEKLRTLVAPKVGEGLIIYLAASKECISAVLVEERGKYQRPIYFILADFLAETQKEDDETDLQDPKKKGEHTCWKLYTDGASSSDGSRASLMIVSPEGMEFTYALKFEFTATNNEAEYEAVQYKRRNQNKKADALSKLALLTFEHLTKKVLVEKLANKLIYEKQVAEVATKEEDSWMIPIIEYLVSGILPADKKLARKIIVKALNYRIIDGTLYKRSFLTPWLRCVGPKQARNVIKEIHGGSCAEIIQSCDACQIHSSVSRLPKKEMTSVTASWPFIQWGIDIIGPLPEALGKVNFLIVVVDYFTKWVKAKPLASVTGKHVERFVWEHIICHFGIPQMIVSDNGKQFEEGAFPQFCERLNIKQAFTFVYHP